jgi:hypothetical protein
MHPTETPRWIYPGADWFVEAFGASVARAWLERHAAPGWWQPVTLDVALPDPACERRDCGDSCVCLLRLEAEMALYHAARKEPADVLEMKWSCGVTSRSPAALAGLRDAVERHFRLTANANHVAVIDPTDAADASLATLHALGTTTLRVVSLGDGKEAVSIITTARRLEFRRIEAVVSVTPGLQREVESLIERLIAAAPDRIVLPSAYMGHVAQRLIGAGHSCVARNVFASRSGQSAGSRRKEPLKPPSTGSVIALGQRSIGRVGPLSYQNHRAPGAYLAALEQGALPIERGLLLTHDDIVRGLVMASLSADFFIDIAMVEAACGIDFRRYFRAEWNALRDFEDMGALSIDAAHLALTPQGRLVCDDVCRVFDQRAHMLTEACERPHLL